MNHGCFQRCRWRDRFLNNRLGIRARSIADRGGGMGRVELAFFLAGWRIHCLARLPDWHGAIGLLVAAAALTLVGRFKLVAGLLAGLIGGLAWARVSAARRRAGDLAAALES